MGLVLQVDADDRQPVFRGQAQIVLTKLFPGQSVFMARSAGKPDFRLNQVQEIGVAGLQACTVGRWCQPIPSSKPPYSGLSVQGDVRRLCSW